MTLKEISKGADCCFAINEITGEIVFVVSDRLEHPDGKDTIFHNKKLDNKAMLNLLFNQEQIDCAWSRMPRVEVALRMKVYSLSERRDDYEINWNPLCDRK